MPKTFTGRVCERCRGAGEDGGRVTGRGQASVAPQPAADQHRGLPHAPERHPWAPEAASRKF